MLDAIVEMLKELPATREFAEDDIIETPQYERGFAISREGEVYTVTGGTVEYILDTTDADDEESMRRFQRMLKAEGIIDALREATKVLCAWVNGSLISSNKRIILNIFNTDNGLFDAFRH